MDHTDSLGNAGRYGDGDLQWMTAGKGIVHGEMFPLLNTDASNPLKLFQIWLNLPRASKMVPPSFVMHWHENIPSITSDDGLTTVVVWAGELHGIRGLPPPDHSLASNEEFEVAVWLLSMQPQATYTLPSASSADVNRAIYFVDGDNVIVARKQVSVSVRVDVDSTQPTSLTNSGDSVATLLVLQGRPIKEPVVQHGPFVMNTQEEIHQAFADYQATKFGGWPWPEDAMVFPKDKGRFALLNGEEIRPSADRSKDEL